ncbi:hypothetical protein E2C01_087285 [Portunus trituberculatus]|uniref:Uncharacterized protein n=1 Tax=Portunus trituberculatus TaxID=210409 RepID=A0A5B7JBH9_PORTR|nr:hypothetical protein [Portunus trituberculatus]
MAGGGSAVACQVEGEMDEEEQEEGEEDKEEEGRGVEKGGRETEGDTAAQLMNLRPAHAQSLANK